MAVFSVPTRHAIFVLTHMVRMEGEKVSTVRDLSKDSGISEPTIAKILRLLVKGGLLVSKKGPGGGFHLAAPRDQITLGRILLAIEGREPFSDCLAGLESCNEENFCPLHEKWQSIKLGLVNFLESTTLQEMELAVLKGNK